MTCAFQRRWRGPATAPSTPAATPCACIDDSPRFQPSSNGHLPEGNGSSASASTPNASPMPPTKLESALKTAIAAARNAETFGLELGYPIRFDADAIKSMAITVLINMSERNSR